MDISTLTQTKETAHIGRRHWKSVQNILDRYDGSVDWAWERKRATSTLTIQLTNDAAWEMRDDLSELFEDIAARRQRC